MDALEFKRRVISNFGINPDKYEGFDFGVVASVVAPSWTTMLDIKVALTPYIPTVGGHSITWNDGLGLPVHTSYQAAFVLHEYNSSKAVVAYSARSSVPRTITLGNNISFVRMTINIDNIANAYIKDNTTGEYLWRGSDYV